MDLIQCGDEFQMQNGAINLNTSLRHMHVSKHLVRHTQYHVSLL
jgi:hypothetical protein